MQLFLQTLFSDIRPGEFIELRAIAAKWAQNEPRVLRSSCESVEIAANMVDAYRNTYPTYDVYVGILPRNGHGSTKKYVTSGQWLWVDIDLKDTPDARDRLAGFEVIPTMIVDSGNGYHAYWKLNAVQSDMEALEKANEGLARTLGGDQCWDRARILRVPGTYNLKDENYPKVVQLELLSNLSYSFDVFDEYKTRAATTASLDNTVPKSVIPAARVFSFDELIQAVLDNFGPLWVKYIYEGKKADTNDFYRSRSELDFAVMNKLVAVGAGYDDVVSVFTNPGLGVSAKALEDPNRTQAYIEATYSKTNRFPGG